MLKLADLRKTTRRTRVEGVRTVYPHLLRDRALSPRIEMAVRYLERMVGQPRSELDQEVVVQLFGDHKVARCVVSALGATYRYQAQRFGDVLSAEQVQALAAHGLRTPVDLRLWLYARANAQGPGFVGGAERAPFLRDAAAALGLAAEEIERLTVLDAPANAVLVRAAPTPTPDDVIARFNYETLAALLANAPLVRLSLRHAPRNADTLRALCAQAGVRAHLSGHDLVLQGQQDALDGWARHGARLVRLLVGLLATGLDVRMGEATVAAPGGGEWLLRLDADTLAYLGACDAATGADFTAEALLEAWRRADALSADFAALRRAGEVSGWNMRRATEPLVTAGGIVPAIFVCQCDVRRVPLVLAPSSDAGMSHLHEMAVHTPLVELNAAAHDTMRPGAETLLPAGWTASRLDYTDRAGVATLPQLLDAALARAESAADTARLGAAFDEAEQAGVLTESRLAEWLGCAEDDVAARLGEPQARALRAARGIRYIEGFGLCTAGVLARVQAAAEEVSDLRAGQPVGSAWVVRTLGRRLREVTGTSQGIECLIAFLGAA